MASLKTASIKQLENEISKRKQAKIGDLKNKRAIIDKEIQALSGDKIVKISQSLAIKPENKRVRKIRKAMSRARVDGTSLNDRLKSVSADGKPRTINEFITALQDSGWKSSSKEPYYVVASSLNTLAKKNIFSRVSKGSYALNESENKTEQKPLDSLSVILNGSDSK